MSKTLEEKLQAVVEQAIINDIAKGYWLRIESGRIKLDTDFLKKVYDGVDMDKVLSMCTKKLENYISDKIMTNMATEIKTDLNKILSDRDLREDIRFYLRKRMKEKAETLQK